MNLAQRDQWILMRDEEIKKLDQEVKSLQDVEEVHSLRIRTKNLESPLEDEVNNDQLSQQVTNLQAQVISVDFDEELYPHMLTAIADHRWVIGHGLAKGMSEGLNYGIEHGKAGWDLTIIEAYDPEADGKYVQDLQKLKDLKYLLLEQLEKLKDAPMELKIPIYHKVRNPEDPWAIKEEMPLEDAIADNISRAEKKRKCRVVCRTHEVGSAHHARSDGFPVLVPTVAPQGLAILLADAATQTEDEVSPRLLRSKSLRPMYNLD
ncbi:hypothetical protein Tco_0231255 [Tanacetum coccineum]